MGRISVTRSARFARGQQAPAGEHELRGGGLYRNQRFHILACHEAAAHGLAEFIQNQNVDL